VRARRRPARSAAGAPSPTTTQRRPATYRRHGEGCRDDMIEYHAGAMAGRKGTDLGKPEGAGRKRSRSPRRPAWRRAADDADADPDAAPDTDAAADPDAPVAPSRSAARRHEAEEGRRRRSEHGPAEHELEDVILDEVVVVPRTPLLNAGDRGGIARRDPLTAYMQEIRRYPLLSREEEHDLADQFYKSGDPALAKQLITSNLRLVVKIAHEYRRSYRNLLDLVQEGNIGLMQAVRKYDPYRGVKLSSYAAWWIRAYILKFILWRWK